MADLKRFGRKLIKAREKHRYKAIQKEEAKTVKAVASARRQETELLRQADMTGRRSKALDAQAAAEERLAAQKASATVALKKQRTAKHKRVMSEKELRKEKMRPILEAPKRLAASVRSVSEGIQKIQASIPKAPVAPVTPTKKPSDSEDLGLGKINLGLDKIGKW